MAVPKHANDMTEHASKKVTSQKHMIGGAWHAHTG